MVVPDQEPPVRSFTMWLVGLALAAVLLAGCDETIEKVNPADPKLGARQFPTPKADPPMDLTRARRVKLEMVVDEHLEPDDNIILINRSDGALYSVELTVNHDYTIALALIEMGETVAVPESWLRTRDGRPFPSERRVRIERVEARYLGQLIAFFDARGNPAPTQ